MKRRDFLVKSVIAGGFLTLGGFGCCQNKDKEAEGKKNSANSDNCILEPAKQIPVLAKADVLIVGGGPAGTAAAIAASRAGAETYLIERYNHLGGLWTGGLVLPLLSTHGANPKGGKIQVIHGIGGEMAKRLQDMGMAIHEQDPIVDPEAAKYVLDEMISEAGVKVIYHSVATDAIMDGKTIKGVFIENKSGRQAILAKVVVDCTGDGDVYKWAGEKFEEISYAIGLVHRLGNIDRIDKNAIGYRKINVGSPTPIPSVTWCNMWGEENQCATDVLNLSRLQQKYRKKIWEQTEELKKKPGYEKVFLLDTASQLGVRASRILHGKYQLRLEDTLNYTAFDDAIGVSGAYTSVDYKGKTIPTYLRPYWQIPYRSLLPKSIENLIVAGRCFSYEKALLEDARIIGTCLVTGHGAGVAASIAAKHNTHPSEIDIKEMRDLLLKQNVWLG